MLLSAKRPAGTVSLDFTSEMISEQYERESITHARPIAHFVKRAFLELLRTPENCD
jgi:hypothetical protein